MAQIDVIAPNGTEGTIDESEYQLALDSGYRIPNYGNSQSFVDNYVKPAIVGVGTAADTALMGVPSLAAKSIGKGLDKLGITDDAQRFSRNWEQAQDKYSGSYWAGTATGLVGSLATTGGRAVLAGANAVGKGAASLTGRLASKGLNTVGMSPRTVAALSKSTLGAPIVAGAALGIEGAALSVPYAIPAAIDGDSEAIGETVVLGGALNVALGGTATAIGKLGSIAKEKISNQIRIAKNREVGFHGSFVKALDAPAQEKLVNQMINKGIVAPDGTPLGTPEERNTLLHGLLRDTYKEMAEHIEGAGTLDQDARKELLERIRDLMLNDLNKGELASGTKNAYEVRQGANSLFRLLAHPTMNEVDKETGEFILERFLQGSIPINMRGIDPNVTKLFESLEGSVFGYKNDLDGLLVRHKKVTDQVNKLSKDQAYLSLKAQIKQNNDVINAYIQTIDDQQASVRLQRQAVNQIDLTNPVEREALGFPPLDANADRKVINETIRREREALQNKISDVVPDEAYIKDLNKKGDKLTAELGKMEAPMRESQLLQKQIKAQSELYDAAREKLEAELRNPKNNLYIPVDAKPVKYTDIWEWSKALRSNNFNGLHNNNPLLGKLTKVADDLIAEKVVDTSAFASKKQEYHEMKQISKFLEKRLEDERAIIAGGGGKESFISKVGKAANRALFINIPYATTTLLQDMSGNNLNTTMLMLDSAYKNIQQRMPNITRNILSTTTQDLGTMRKIVSAWGIAPKSVEEKMDLVKAYSSNAKAVEYFLGGTEELGEQESITSAKTTTAALDYLTNVAPTGDIELTPDYVRANYVKSYATVADPLPMLEANPLDPVVIDTVQNVYPRLASTIQSNLLNRINQDKPLSNREKIGMRAWLGSDGGLPQAGRFLANVWNRAPTQETGYAQNKSTQMLGLMRATPPPSKRLVTHDLLTQAERQYSR